LKRLLVILTLILIIINALVIYNYGFYERRLVRIISITLFFLIFLFLKGYKDSRIVLVFVLLLIVDFLGVFYEKGLIALIGPIIKLFAYIILIASVTKKIELKKISLKTSILPAIIILLNIFLIFTVVQAVFASQNDFKEIILYIVYGTTIVGAAFLAVNYNFRYGSKRSVYYLFLVFALVLSDAAWFIAYYFKTKTAFYFDTVFYFIALCYIILFAVTTKSSDDKLSELMS